MTIGSEVLMPWPISGCFEMRVTRPSRPIRMNAFGANSPVPAAPAGLTTSLCARSAEMPSSRPPPATPDWRRKRRRAGQSKVAALILPPWLELLLR